jgi:hypothetical protein
MMEQRANHPLDIDLLSYALGEIDAAFAAELDLHLGDCLLCRIHLNRIRRGGLDLGPDVTPTFSYPEIAPTVLDLVHGRHRPITVQPGQLWLAGSSPRALVWTEAVNDSARMATVLAATLDVEAADHTSLIVGVPSLGRDIAIFTSIPGWIPLDQLDTFVDDVDVVEEIAELQASIEQSSAPPRQRKHLPKLRVGTRISGASDERLEFRQMLADQLAGLDPENDEADADREVLRALSQPDPVVQMRNELARDLPARRHGLCEVKYLDSEFLVGSYARGLAVQPVATVHELDCVMLVVTGGSSQAGLGFDPEDAYKLLLDSGAESLAVAEPTEPYLTHMFERSVLRPAFEPPRAIERHAPRPLWESRPLIQALFDYLQGDVFPIESEPQPTSRSHPDLAEFLPTHSATAIVELKQIRAQKGKHRALKALGPRDVAALHDAIATSPNLDALLARIEEITVR